MTDDRFKRIVENLPEVVWLLDEELEEVLYVNSVYQEFIRQIGSDGDGSLTRESLVDPTDKQAAEAWFAQITQDIQNNTVREEYEYEASISAHDGTDYWVETVGVPVTEDDAVVGLAGLSSDITEERARQQQLEAEVNRLDQFASMLGHDLRTPLTVAQGNLHQYMQTNDEEALKKVNESLSRIDQITSDLLDISRGTDEEAEFTTVALDAIAEEAWDTSETDGATLETDGGEITADRSKLRTLYENLFRNAVEHGGSNVTVRVGPIEDGFFVEDTGTGMPEDLRNKVLEYGFTAGSAGSGIGLTIVERVADLHGWTVALDASREGGARFEFRSVDEE